MNPNDPKLKSFVAVAADSDFPIQNLPYGVFSTGSNPVRRVGVAIGEFILDLAVLEAAGLLKAGTAPVFNSASLNAFMALGRPAWRAARARISELLRVDTPTLRDDAALRAKALVPMAEARLHLPIGVAGYTDFYSSREHATNVGMMFRDKDNPLLPNWLHIPIGYNGRANTIVVDGTPIRRPLGQLKGPNDPAPVFAPCRKLDFELEMAAIVGQGTQLGDILTPAQAEAAIFGYALLNDWSARDIQQWEYVPLGPFQAKVFASSLSPWVVSAEALESFKADGPEQAPVPLAYLQQPQPRNYDIVLEVGYQPAGASEATVVSRTNFKTMYWSSVQQLVHHAIGGCAMSVGDVLGSGTVSGGEKHQRGSLLELTWNGAEPLAFPDGQSRTFLQDGDTLILRGWAERDGVRIGFGQVAGTILPAHQAS